MLRRIEKKQNPFFRGKKRVIVKKQFPALARPQAFIGVFVTCGHTRIKPLFGRRTSFGISNDCNRIRFFQRQSREARFRRQPF
jgi:hypothetical protein